MKLAYALLFALILLFSGIGCPGPSEPGGGAVGGAIVVNHTTTTLSAIPDNAIAQAKSKLNIAYGHTSHGSQLITGMEGLVSWKGSLYSFSSTGTGGALQLRDTPFQNADDLGAPDRTTWASSTRSYLNSNPEVNVVMWSWCGEASTATASDISSYLSLMSKLETDFPSVRFVYMTGHLDGTGTAGNLYLRNEQIRTYCRANGKVLFDFADIESYNPDGVSFVDKMANDNCDYDSNGDGSNDGNWAIEWQDAHPSAWFNCSPAHTQALNGNLKAFAAWNLFARLGGWNGL